MIGQNHIISEVYYLGDAAQTISFAEENDLGMLSMWSINRDHPCEVDLESADPTCSGFTDVDDWEYARSFGSDNE